MFILLFTEVETLRIKLADIKGGSNGGGMTMDS